MTCVVPDPPPPPQQPVDDKNDGVSVPWHNWFTRQHAYLACIAREGFTGATGATGATGSDGSGMVPYFIAATETFTVPLYKQALYAMTIDNEGDLVIDGYLILVD